MELRFRKRVKVLPGVTLNFSKSGISTTIGGKGASINIGKKGVYANAEMPGTGIYMREKIAGGKKPKAKRTAHKTYAGNYTNVGNYTNAGTPATRLSDANTDNPPFGCLAIILSIILGVFFGWGVGNIKYAFAIAPALFILACIFRLLTKQDQTPNNENTQAAATEKVLLDELLQYKSVIDEPTLQQLLEYKKIGAKHVNIPIGTLAELKRMKSAEMKKTENLPHELGDSLESDTFSLLESFKKDALLCEFEKDYEKASDNWVMCLHELMESNHELDESILERALHCLKKTTNLHRELCVYEDLIKHYPNHPKLDEWKNEQIELESIIKAQGKV